MKRSKYSDSQILAIIKQNEAGVPVPELCREHGMSSATFYKWCYNRSLSRIIFPDYLVDLLVYLLLTDINAQVGDVINHSTGIAMANGINDIDPSDNCASQNNLITDIIFEHGFELVENPCQ